MNTSRLLLCLLAPALLLGNGVCRSDTVFHVTPDGPLASLDAARRAVRKLKAEQGLKEPVQVLIAPGTYAMRTPVVFSPEDSGTAECPIVYKASENDHPVFSGGQVITGFKRNDDGSWAARIPAVADGTWYFEQLWVNGRRAARARFPNTFWHYTVGKVGHGVDPDNGKSMDLSTRAFHAEPEHLAPLLRVPENRRRDVTIVAYHSWETSRSRLASIDAKRNHVFVTHPIPWGFNHWGPRQRWHAENFREALDAPGEWFLDRDGTLYYRPLPGEDISTTRIIAPAGSEFFVRFEGNADKGERVAHVRLEGLRFQHGQYILPPNGHGDSQAEVTVPAVIMADGAHHISLADCAIEHVGIYGIWFRRGCRNCSVTRTLLNDLGGGGIKIGEGWGSDLKNPDAHTGHITVDNCIVHKGARIHTGSIGIWIGHSGDNQVTHNDISDLYYTGVSVGWSWGYAPTLSLRNHIDFNHIHHLGWGVLSDMGGVYTLGLSDGTTVNRNVIHDVYSYDHYGRGGWGLYNDEGTTHITMASNLVYNVKTGTYHQHYGRENLICNNILALSSDGQIQRSRIEPHLSFTLTRNIIYWREGELYTHGGGFKDDKAVSASNLYWNASGTPVTFHGATLDDWQAKGREKGSIVADPLFVNPEQGDFRIKSGSPVSRIGFVAFDYTQAGLYGDADWVARPGAFVFPPVAFGPPPPPPPPLCIDDDFDGSPVGSKPALAGLVSDEGKTGAIAVTDEVARSGKHSLALVDSPDNTHAFDPHVVYYANHARGTTTCSFDLRLREGVQLNHEWRTWNTQPYRVGPSITISGGHLRAAGKDLLAVPQNTWIHVELQAKVGRDADGTWRLTVTLPGQEPAVFTGLPCHGGFGELTWIGWCSLASRRTVCHIDNLRIVSDAR